ncbi:replication protein [Bifidobacterium sp. DSM 109960]|uniref:Replication protein n=1 Tax=Bifidobacterium erythrocebi TaxID=2675325 RepID=A0A7Y0EV80_9BIFI|nr:replication protein RepA [Bifidobacterium sp. DSM 109960]NMM97045.1 replication protein [Bifidobacterium sp. DSM 109960]
MVDNTPSKDLVPPEGEPWMSHGFVSKIAAQVSLPYRRPKDGTKEIVRRNGTLEVRFATGADSLPYGKYPRLFELWACTMIKTGDPCFDPETNTLNLGATFREFLRLIGVNIGGRQLKSVKPQLERLFECSYHISNNTKTQTNMRNFVVAEKAHIDWLRDKPQRTGRFENWVQLSKGYVDMLREYPVPVDLKVISRLRKPMALDIYWWLTKRVYNLHKPSTITWAQLYQQFGNNSELRKFKENFKEALADVLAVYPADVTVGPQRVTIFPSNTSVPTVAQTRAAEKRARLERVHDSRGAEVKAADPEDTGHWQKFDAKWEVFTTSELFDVTAAREHRDALVRRENCRFCKFDQRNEEHHGEGAEMMDVPLFD